MSCSCGGYCHRCRGMIWSLFGILILVNAFIWPKWIGVDGWFAFLGILLMFMGVWKAYVNGCACKKDDCCNRLSEEKPVVAEKAPEVHEVHSVSADLAAIHTELPVVTRAPARKPKKRKR